MKQYLFFFFFFILFYFIYLFIFFPVLGVVIFFHSMDCHGSRKPFWEKSSGWGPRASCHSQSSHSFGRDQVSDAQGESAPGPSPPSRNECLPLVEFFHIFVETDTKTVIQPFCRLEGPRPLSLGHWDNPLGEWLSWGSCNHLPEADSADL